MDKPNPQRTNLKEYWCNENLKMKNPNPSAKQYGYSMNLTTESQGTNQPNVATILEQCANLTWIICRQKR